jgi:PAS domain S-box-containing protein
MSLPKEPHKEYSDFEAHSLVSGIEADLLPAPSEGSASENSFRDFRTCVPSALVIADEQGSILFVNAATNQLFGYEHEELQGQNLEILVPERFWQMLRRRRAAYAADPLARSTGVELELYGLRKHGAEFPAEISLSSLKTAAGVVFTSTIRDITSLKRANEQHAYLASIVNSTNDAIISKSLDGIIRSWNGGAERLFGYSAQEIIGHPIALLIPPERAAEGLKLLERALQGETIIALETERLRKNGEIFHVSITVSPIWNADSRIVGVSKIARDITDRKRAEEALRRANKDLLQFAYAAAHDLQEPLRNISVTLGILKETYLWSAKPETTTRAEANTLIDDSISSAQQMLFLVKGLLAFSKVVDGAKAGAAPVDAHQVLSQVLKTLGPTIAEKEAQVTYVSLPKVRIESIFLFQLLQNLIGNALKYRHPDRPPIIEVSAVREGNDWVFAVADNGIGFDPAYAEHIFGLFKRLHKKEEYPGTGIGLAICARIVAAYGGRIWAEGRPGDGAIFRFKLPGELGEWKQVPIRDATKILVVEDNPVDVWMLRDALQREKSWATELSVVTDGEAAIHYLRRQRSFANASKPDLIILDLNLPKRDGTEVLQVIRSTDDLKGLPVFVFSSSPEDVVQERIQNANVTADRYVTKPIDAKELQVLGEVLRRSFEDTQSAGLQAGLKVAE